MNVGKRWLSVLAILIGLGVVYLGSMLGIKQVPQDTVVVETTKYSRGETIYFWYCDETITDYVNRAAVTFGEQQDVHVLPVLVSPQEYLEQVNSATLANEQMPDVFLMSNEQVERAYLAGFASKVPDSGICTEDNFGKAGIAGVTYRGSVVGYPFSYETCVLLYNDTYLLEWATQMAKSYLVEADDESTESEEELSEEELYAWQQKHLAREQYAAMSEEEQAAWVEELALEYYGGCIPSSVDDILNISESYNAPDTLKGIMSWDLNNILYDYWVLGGTMVVGGEAGDDKSQLSVNNENAVAALKAYQALKEAFFIEADTIEYRQVISDFIEGKYLFVIASTDVVKTLEEAVASGEMTFDYGLCTMPDVTEEIPGRTVSVTDLVAVNSYSEHKETANAFAKFLVMDAAEDLYELTGRAPAYRYASEDNNALQVFAMSYDESISLPKFIETENFWLRLEAMFARVWQDADAQEELDTLQEGLEEQISGS